MKLNQRQEVGSSILNIYISDPAQFWLHTDYNGHNINTSGLDLACLPGWIWMNCFFIELFWNYQLTRVLISAQKTSTQQNRPESPTVTLNWHTSKNEEHKLHQRYMLRLRMKGCSCTTKVQAAAFSCPYLTENKAPWGCLCCQWHYKNLSSLLLPSCSVIYFLLIKLLLNITFFF